MPSSAPSSIPVGEAYSTHGVGLHPAIRVIVVLDVRHVGSQQFIGDTEGLPRARAQYQRTVMTPSLMVTLSNSARILIAVLDVPSTSNTLSCAKRFALDGALC